MNAIDQRPKKKALHPFARATRSRDLVAAHRAIALPTAALLQLLLAGCGGRVEAEIHGDEAAQTKTARATVSASATSEAVPPPPIAPKTGGAPEIEQTFVLTPPPPPPPPPKPVLGKPHNIKPPRDPQPLGGDLMMVIPRPLGTGAKPV